MRHLAYLKATQEFERQILALDGINPPPSGIHCTLWGFNIAERDESRLVQTLSAIRVEPFNICVEGYAELDEASLALLVSVPSELRRLHEAVVRAASPFDKNTLEFDHMVDKFGLDRYNPHFTVSKGSSASLRAALSAIRAEMPVSCFYLSRKKGVWQEVEQFPLRG